MCKRTRFPFLGLVLLLASASWGASSHLPFIHDDYGTALARAKQSKLAIFVEAWAPW